MRAALDSLLAQTYTNFELIISDNASTDGTREICQEYVARDSRIRYIRQPENRGAAGNFQFVLEAAGCDFFMWASADDRWDSRWLAALVERLHPGVSIAFGSSIGFLDNGQTEKRITFRSLTGPRTLRMLTYYFWSEGSHKANVIYGLFRTTELRRAVAEVFQGDENRFGFDNILVFTMLRAGGLRIEPGVTLYKRSKLGVAQFQPGKLLTWRRAAVFALHLSKLNLVPYLVEHGRRAPAGLTRCAVVTAMPLKFALMVSSGLGPAAALLFRRVRAKGSVAVQT